MKRYFGGFALLFAIILLVSSVSGDGITGQTTSSDFDLRIYVAGTPTVIVFSPRAGTYLINQSLPVEYSISEPSNSWYTLDGSSPAVIPSGIANFSLDLSEGNHIIIFYANNSNGITVNSIAFDVNTTLFSILYQEDYKTSHSGESTDFYYYTYEELQNLSGIALEDVRYGKVQFDNPVNLTDDMDHNLDWVVDIQGNVNISSDSLSLNADELPNFNISATIWLYNLTFDNPRILRNGEVCPSDICTKEAYDFSNGTFRFRVTGFSVYSAEETPVPSGGGGGGG